MSVRTLSQQKFSTNNYARIKPTSPKGSVYFTSGQYLSVAGNSAFSFGTSGDFTVEAFVRMSALECAIVSTYGGWWLQNRSSNFTFGVGDNFIFSRAYSSTSTWVHVAVTRASGYLRMFFNGVQQSSAQYDTTNFTSQGNNVIVGGLFQSGGGYNFSGYVSNLRIVTNAQYTTSFTAPTSALPAVSGTALLTCRDSDKIIDASSNALAITTSGATASSINPFP